MARVCPDCKTVDCWHNHGQPDGEALPSLASLAEFLIARTAEEEARALADLELVAGAPRRPGKVAARVAAFRILDDCEVRRRIITEHTHPPGPFTHLIPTCPRCVQGDGGQGSSRTQMLIPCPTLRALAIPFQDHPDYLSDWRAVPEDWRP